MISDIKYSKSPAYRDDRCPPTQGETKHATQNACKMCAPLGASLAFAGIKGCISILHGSQGCATYIRRYLISHFREPMDIASSSFSEEDAVFGGGRNLKLGIDNVSEAYGPEVIGVATTCLAETIGEDVPQILREYRESKADAATELPFFIQVSTPSYTGDHWGGFHKTVRAIIEHAAALPSTNRNHDGAPVLLLPGMLSCEDFRYLKRVFKDFALPCTLTPDYSDTLDGGSWSSYQRIPQGGTPIQAVRDAYESGNVITLGAVSSYAEGNAGAYLEDKFSSECYRLPLPIGIRATDTLFETLAKLSDSPVPEHFTTERARLVDSYVDGHKYLSGKKAVVYADPDLLTGLVSFLSETGIRVVAAVAGSKCADLENTLRKHLPSRSVMPERIVSNADHAVIATLCRELEPDLIVGNSKGYPISRELDIPLVRCGMPIHDRVGAQRILHLGYEGAQRLYDNVVNTLMQHRQDENEIGFSYL